MTICLIQMLKKGCDVKQVRLTQTGSVLTEKGERTMPDREKVKYDIERCICHVPDACRDCSHYKHGEYLDCMEELLKDALALLKEQEADMIALKNAYKELAEKGSVIVRCKDCKKRNISECPLHYGGHTENDTDDDWFCADGEVKRDG